MARTAKAAECSAAMQTTFHHPALAGPESAADYIEKQWSTEKSQARYGWIYEYDANLEPI